MVVVMIAGSRWIVFRATSKTLATDSDGRDAVVARPDHKPGVLPKRPSHGREGVFLMRWMHWVSAALFLSTVVWSQSVWAINPGCGCRTLSGDGPINYAALSGGACCSPTGFAMAPGCCEYYKPCCDNAWAGYCEHRQKVDAFWSRVGTPHPRVCTVPPRRAMGFTCDPDWTDATMERTERSVSAMPPSRPTPAVRPAPDAPHAK